MTAFQLAPKWQKGANGGFCKFGSFQPNLTHRQLDWSSMMFIESHFYGYPTCLVFAHVVWWLRALWTARTPMRTGPGSLLTWGCIISAEIFFNKDVMCCGDGGWDETFLFCQHVWPHLVHVSWWSTTPWTARTNWRRWPGRSLTLGCITLIRIFFNWDVICCSDGHLNESCLYFWHVWPHKVYVGWWWMALRSARKTMTLTREVADIRIYHIS